MASFRAGRLDFVLLAAHVRWGATVAGRREELAAVVEWIVGRTKEAYFAEKDVLVVGDFNVQAVDGRDDQPAQSLVRCHGDRALLACIACERGVAMTPSRPDLRPERQVVRDLERERRLAQPPPGEQLAPAAVVEVDRAGAAGEARRLARQAEDLVVPLAVREVRRDALDPRMSMMHGNRCARRVTT